MSTPHGNSANGAMLSPTPPAIETASGVYVDLLEPVPATLNLRDVARGLAYTCRYGGHVRRFYSVAEHCILVRDLLRSQDAPEVVQRAALFHDAPEAYLGDVVAPLKWAMRSVSGPIGSDGHGSAYDLITQRMERALCERFGLLPQVLASPKISTADLWALRIEAAELTETGGACWRWPGELPNGGLLPDGVTWEAGLSPDDARVAWLDAVKAPASDYDRRDGSR